MPRLSRDFYRQDALTLARELIGCTLISENGGAACGGVIVEAEAYLGAGDPACHTYGGRRTARNRVMYQDGGFAYVYLIYGVHCCFNAVCSREGEGQAVLIRALRPTAGIETMISRRGAVKPERLCAGPGNLCRALSITLEDNGADLVCSRLYILPKEYQPEILCSPRINIAYAGAAADYPWRFTEAGSVFVSVKPKALKEKR